jgi:hypothetical protein
MFLPVSVRWGLKRSISTREVDPEYFPHWFYCSSTHTTTPGVSGQHLYTHHTVQGTGKNLKASLFALPLVQTFHLPTIWTFFLWKEKS